MGLQTTYFLPVPAAFKRVRRGVERGAKQIKRSLRAGERQTHRSLRESEKFLIDWIKPPEYPDAPQIPDTPKETGEDPEIARVRAEIERRRRNRRSLIVRNPGGSSGTSYSGLRV